jgi:hypothetical protein
MQMARASIYNAEDESTNKLYRLFIAHKSRQELWIPQANTSLVAYLGRGVYGHVILFVKILIIPVMF